MGQSSLAGGTSSSSCTDVTTGLYRQGPTVDGTITDGYYTSSAGEYYPIPTRLGAICPPGSFCTGGVIADCVAGTRCENELTSTNVVSGQDECDAGYYCIGGCNRRRPTDLSLYKGDICT